MEPNLKHPLKKMRKHDQIVATQADRPARDIRYLVPADLTVAAMISAIYEVSKDEDGFLYMTYREENSFGIY
ncbi:hypothetical protein FH972_014393 [Carpinus fangiana]|uniref:Autophagy-related protein n=1 Tax=Carpinus fangiana TaxID=176857 RepID=A0A5N6RD26_9ROSI|nr:hypothetical protein FH972_014393 [Carpinus fangiana]